MSNHFKREIFYYKNHYSKFFKLLRPEIQRKFNWTLQLIATTDRVPEKFFKHISGSRGLYEIRVEVKSDIFRVFSFFDDGNLIILINGFQKKSDKTPRNEILLAEKLKNNYFNEKKEL